MIFWTWVTIYPVTLCCAMSLKTCKFFSLSTEVLTNSAPVLVVYLELDIVLCPGRIEKLKTYITYLTQIYEAEIPRMCP